MLLVTRAVEPSETGGRWLGIISCRYVVYYLVHSLGARDFERQDREAARIVSREAARAGVAQIVYLGGLGGEERCVLTAAARRVSDWPRTGCP